MLMEHKFLIDKKYSGVLPLTKENSELLVQKYPEPKESSPDILIQRPTNPIHPTASDDMDES